MFVTAVCVIIGYLIALAVMIAGTAFVVSDTIKQK